MVVTASAPAKTILFGEHAVVYGEPAIAVPLSGTRTFAEMRENGQVFRILSHDLGFSKSFSELEDGSGLQRLLSLLMEELHLKELPKDTLSIRSSIPIASGLGSGAALSAAVIRAFFLRYGENADPETVNRIAYEIEKVYHGNPSGIDNTVITFEEPVFFVRGSGFTRLKAETDVLHLLIVDTGIRSRTVDVVSDVRDHLDRNEKFIREIGALVREAAEALEAHDTDKIGALMNRNQQLLRAIDVSSPELDDLTSLALSEGALGAKLTGAGRGGNFIVLSRDTAQANRLKHLYESKGLRVIL